MAFTVIEFWLGLNFFQLCAVLAFGIDINVDGTTGLPMKNPSKG